MGNEVVGVSIIMPIYNAELFIDTTIKSILCQTFANFELILVDDGSTDNSLERCFFYARKDQRVKVYIEKNSGPGIARNVGIDNAKMSYLTFIDSDDYVVPNYLESLVKYGKEGYDLVLSGYYHIEYEKICKGDFHSYNSKSIYDDVTASNFKELSEKFIKLDHIPSALASACMKLFKTNVILENNIRFGNYLGGEDELFTYQYICKVNSIKRLNWAGYYYIKYNEANRVSLSSSHTCVVTLDWISEMLSIYAYLIKKFNISNEAYLHNIRWRFINWYTSLAIKGYFKETYLPYRKRIELWNKISKEPYIVTSNLSDTYGVRKCKYILLICKCRLYFLLDPFFLLLAKFQ